MTTKRMIFHIGFPKTGSTSMQTFLHERRHRLLKKKQLLYPSSTPNHSNLLLTMFMEYPERFIANRLEGYTKKADMEDLIQKYYTELENEIDSTDYETIFFSAEGMINLRVPELEKLKSWGSKYADEWTILVYVRHPVKYTISVTQELLKMGRTLDFIYGKLPVPYYKRKIERYASVFGMESIQIYDFETTAQDNLIHNFCKQMGIDDIFTDFPNKRLNVSMSRNAALVLDRINNIRPIFAKDGKVNQPRDTQTFFELSRIKGRKFTLPVEVQKEIMIKACDDIAWLNNEFGLSLYQDVVQKDQDSLSEAKDLNSDCDWHQETVNYIADIILELHDIKQSSEIRKFLYTVRKELAARGTQ